jgi:hypothetical protein
LVACRYGCHCSNRCQAGNFGKLVVKIGNLLDYSPAIEYIRAGDVTIA